jgi:proton-translocating NADH-quinone oxidoreductase chain M
MNFNILELISISVRVDLSPWIIKLLLIWPLFSLVFVTFIKKSDKEKLNLGLYLSSFSFILALILLWQMNSNNTFFQYIFDLEISPLTQDHKIYFGIDFISISLIILTNLFTYLCILSLNITEIKKKYTLTEILNKLFFIQWGLLCAFSSLDLISFFIFFEATLIPIFQIILQGGSRERKSRAGILIALYTLLGSIFMLFNIIYLFNKYGTTNYLYLYTISFDIEDQKILWITFFLAFAAKIPVFPFHIWLPEAHVEAPTIGSVLLAALLLKLGIYGLIRFGLPLFPYGQEYFKHVVVTLTICSFFYTNLTAIRQVDIKKIIAYSSVVHMNLIVLGILCLSVESLDGAIYQMIAHGIVSGALFFCIGILYERFKSRFLWYYGGIAFILPIYSIFLFIFILANISFPMTSNFIGEMLLFLGIFKDNFIIGVFACTSMFWGIIYNIWTYNRISFGNIKLPYTEQKNSHNFFKDINKKDLYILSILLFFLILTGIYSSLILDYITLNSTRIVDKNFYDLYLIDSGSPKEINQTVLVLATSLENKPNEIDSLNLKLNLLYERLGYISQHKDFFIGIKHNFDALKTLNKVLSPEDEFEMVFLLENAITTCNDIIKDSEEFQKNYHSIWSMELHTNIVKALLLREDCSEPQIFGPGYRELEEKWRVYCKETSNLTTVLSSLRIQLAELDPEGCNPCILKAIKEPKVLLNEIPKTCF